jgi:hypothetical protein
MYLDETLEALFYAVLIFGICSRLPLCVPMAIFVSVALKKGAKRALEMYRHIDDVTWWDDKVSDLEEEVFNLEEKLRELKEEKAAISENETWLLYQLEMKKACVNG